MLTATITLPDPKGLVARAFLPEDKSIKGKASYRVRSGRGKVTFAISAPDSVGLRTVMNSITKMLTVIERMQKVK